MASRHPFPPRPYWGLGHTLPHCPELSMLPLWQPLLFAGPFSAHLFPGSPWAVWGWPLLAQAPSKWWLRLWAPLFSHLTFRAAVWGVGAIRQHSLPPPADCQRPCFQGHLAWPGSGGWRLRVWGECRGTALWPSPLQLLPSALSAARVGLLPGLAVCLDGAAPELLPPPLRGCRSPGAPAGGGADTNPVSDPAHR